jgi:hypothetical protein
MNAMGHPRILDEDWPVVVVEWPERANAAGIKLHFDEMVALLAQRPGPFAVVVDATKARGLDADLRARTAKGIEQLTQASKGRIKGIAYVVPSALMRGIITAIHWLVRAPAPTATFALRGEALRWVRERLAASAARPS